MPTEMARRYAGMDGLLSCHHLLLLGFVHFPLSAAAQPSHPAMEHQPQPPATRRVFAPVRLSRRGHILRRTHARQLAPGIRQPHTAGGR